MMRYRPHGVRIGTLAASLVALVCCASIALAQATPRDGTPTPSDRPAARPSSATPATPATPAAPAPSSGATAPPTADDTRAPAVDAEAAARVEADRRKIDAVLGRMVADPAMPDTAKRIITDAWKRRRPEADVRPFLEEALAVASPEYRKALDAITAGKLTDAERGLRPLLDDKRPYVASHAASMLARVLVDQERIDDALALLNRWRDHEQQVADSSFQGPEMEFLRAYCLLQRMEYGRAAALFEEFETRHPDAPERLRLTARQILQELRQRRPDGLGDVSDLMRFASRQLRHGLSDTPVTEAQAKAVTLLTKLIEEAEEQEKQQQQQNGQGGGQGSRSQSGSQGGQNPSSPMQNSVLPTGAMPEGSLDRSPTARPGEAWGNMPPKQREQILQALRRNFPSRYRDLVEQYYKQLGKEP